jgi:hypothetical protein
MAEVLINLKRDQSWKGKIYSFHFKRKMIRMGKNVYPFQGKGGQQRENKISTPKSCVQNILKDCQMPLPC